MTRPYTFKTRPHKQPYRSQAAINIAPPKAWADRIRKRLTPRTLQVEIALMVLWDLNSEEYNPYFEEWLGEDGSKGCLIPVSHSREEIVEAMKTIEYPLDAIRIRGIPADYSPELIGIPSPGLVLGKWRGPPDLAQSVFTLRLCKQVHAAFLDFFKRRGIPAPVYRKSFYADED